MASQLIDGQVTFVSEVKNYTQNFGSSISYIKESLSKLYKFTTLNPKNTFETIQIFNSTKFSLNYFTLF